MSNSTNRLWILGCILLFALLARIFHLGNPPSYYFDEVYHAFTAKAYAKNDPRGYEWWHTSPEKGTAYEWLHPPISKLLMAGSIRVLGETGFAWRLPGALLGVLVVYLTYYLTRQITNKDSIALLAAFLASLDGLLLTQSRIAMNDIYVTAFILLTVIFYLHWLKTKQGMHLIATSLFAGLSLATKWSGLFVIGVIGFIEVWLWVQNRFKFDFKRYSKLAIALIVVPFCIYILSFTQFFLQNHTVDQFIELHRQIFWYQFNLDATHPYQSLAWQWPFLLRPVWLHVDYSIPGRVGNIYAMSNPFISWFGVIAVIWFIKQYISQPKFHKIPYLVLIASYFFVWFPWITSPRIMFYYHYTPAISFMVIMLAIFLHSLYQRSRQQRLLATNLIALIAATFFFFYPHWIGLPMAAKFNDLYYWFSFWK